MSPIDQLLIHRLVQNNGSAPTYVYLYNHESRRSLGRTVLGIQRNDMISMGVTLGDDSLPLYPAEKRFLFTFMPDEADFFIRKSMLTMVTNFLYKG